MNKLKNYTLIILSILIFQDAWISPGKWGSSIILLLLIGSAGLMVLLRAGRIDTGLAFLFTLFHTRPRRFKIG